MCGPGLAGRMRNWWFGWSSRGSAASLDEAEDTLADQGLDPLLDDPRLLDGLLESRQGSNASLALFAYVVVRHALAVGRR